MQALQGARGDGQDVRELQHPQRLAQGPEARPPAAVAVQRGGVPELAGRLDQLVQRLERGIALADAGRAEAQIAAK